MKSSVFLIDSGSLNLAEIKSLFLACKWDWPESDSEMKLAFKKSFRLYGCLVDGKLVGFGRLISDKQIYGLLVDCMVHPDFRKRGIGTALAEYSIKDARKSGLKAIQLLASQDGFSVYQKVGFKTYPTTAVGMMKMLKIDNSTE